MQWIKRFFGVKPKEQANWKMVAQPVEIATGAEPANLLMRHAARLARLYNVQGRGEDTKAIRDEIRIRKGSLMTAGLDAPETELEAMQMYSKIKSGDQ